MNQSLETDHIYSRCEIQASALKRKHVNRKTFVAGDRFKWSRYSNDHTRMEYGYPSGCWYDTESKDRYDFLVSLYGDPQYYGKTYRKYRGEPPRFNERLLRTLFALSWQFNLTKQSNYHTRWLKRSKNSWV